jgi:hypothetical protein
VPSRPWEKVAADHFSLHGKAYLVVVDFFSKYPEVVSVSSKTAEKTVAVMKSVFARHGIQDIIVADNQPFNSHAFCQVAKAWDFKVQTSSPTYAQSNGMAERCVQTVKNLMKKSKEAGEDMYLGLLNYRITPVTGMDKSPAELLMGRMLRSTVPVMSNRLTPPESESVNKSLTKVQNKQKYYYDRTVEPLTCLTVL